MIVSFICPYQGLSSQPVLWSRPDDVNFSDLENCPPPLQGKKATVVTIGYNPYVLMTDNMGSSMCEKSFPI